MVKQGDKKEHTKQEHSYTYKHPYTYKHHENVTPSSPPKIYDAVYAGNYEENITLVEPIENEQVRTRIPIEDTPKRRLQDTPTYYPIQEASEQIGNTTKRELPLMRDGTRELPLMRDGTGKVSTSDDIFGHMVANSLGQIEDEQQKELLKLNIQTLIYNVRFRKIAK